MIDWRVPEHNDFFLASQVWAHGDMYRRRCDLVGFVNGLPLVLIELNGHCAGGPRGGHAPKDGS